MAQGASHVIPTPNTLHVHDDLTYQVRRRQGVGSPVHRLVQELFELLRRDAGRIRVLTEVEQVKGLLAQEDHQPFDFTVGIGRAGDRVARTVHDRAGWFPVIRRVDIFRVEDGRGGYDLVSTAAEPLEAQLQGLEGVSSLAVVDDTIFSGLTMRAVLRAMPEGVLPSVHAFCLRCVAETLPSIEALCPVSAGFAAPGRILEEVSFINASGLVTRVGIRRAGKPPMAFFERREWMQAWFPGYADEVIALCRSLNRELSAD